ncbi:MAG: hypothetical protein HZA93_23100 [Verrucomicrobia bacterium]|nr:hypothetical protein [Verrucomicrobiota bacterium]
MSLFRLVLLLAGAAPAWAGLSSAVIVLPTDTGRAAPAVSIVQPADYLCAVVTLRTTARDTDRQSAAMRESLQRVTNAIQKSPRFQLHQGAVRLAAGSSAVFSSKAGAGPASLQTTLRVLCPLQGDLDIFESMKQIRNFISSLAPAADTELNVVSISLAVADPEQYRQRLLALIADQSRAVQQNFSARTVIIDGLQNPVSVRQVDDSHVELFIDYQMSANLDVR